MASELKEPRHPDWALWVVMVISWVGTIGAIGWLVGTSQPPSNAPQVAALSRQVATLRDELGSGVRARDSSPVFTQAVTILPGRGQGVVDLAALDPAGIPVCWIDSGSEDGIGGLSCASHSGKFGDGYVSSGTDIYHRDAALTPAGTLMLAPCGRRACEVTLTASDLRRLLQLIGK